jgi:hypothetical protein
VRQAFGGLYLSTLHVGKSARKELASGTIRQDASM